DLVVGLLAAHHLVQGPQLGDRLAVHLLDQVAGLQLGLGGRAGRGHLRDADAVLGVVAEQADVDAGLPAAAAPLPRLAARRAAPLAELRQLARLERQLLGLL